MTAILHGAVVVTQNIDVCLKFSRENLTQLAAALADLHPCHRLTPNQLPFARAQHDGFDGCVVIVDPAGMGRKQHGAASGQHVRPAMRPFVAGQLGDFRRRPAA